MHLALEADRALIYYLNERKVYRIIKAISNLIFFFNVFLVLKIMPMHIVGPHIFVE